MPDTRPPASSMAETVFSTWSTVVRPTRVTTMTLSASRERTTESVTGSTGGASMMTTWSWARKDTNSDMCWEPSSSEGFGGVSVQGRILNPEVDVVRSACSRGAAPMRTSGSPRPSSRSKLRCTPGRRRSASTRMTSSPARAITLAKFPATEDFPSPCTDDVTRMTLELLSIIA